MIYFSDRPFWLQERILTISKSINQVAININNITNFNIEHKSFCLIPIFGEDELMDDWIYFFEKIANNEKNIAKQLVLFLFGVYDFEIDQQSTLFKQINHILKFNSIDLKVFPLKLHKDFLPLKDMVYFCEHINKKQYSNFDILIKNVIFKTKTFPLINNCCEINFTDFNDGYSSILKNTESCILRNIILKCDRKKLVLNRIKHKQLSHIIDNSSNNKVEAIYLISNQINNFPNFKGFSNLRYLNLTANYIDLIDIDRIPNCITTLDVSKNRVAKINFFKNIELKRLCLFNNNLSDINGVEKLKALEYINLGLNPLDVFPLKLLECKNLKHINLSLTNIKKLPEAILKLSKLDILDLTQCKQLKKDSIIEKLKNKNINVIF